jgi:hypothetical protein
MARRRAMSTGMALFLIAVGAILWFAVRNGSLFGLNLHIVGIVLLLTGIVGLLLPRMAGGSLKPRRLSPWLRPRGRDHPHLDEIKKAAAADDAAIQEDDKYFSPVSGRDEDDL